MAVLQITFKGSDEVSGAAQQVAQDVRGVGQAAQEATPAGTGFFSGMLQTATGFLASNIVGNIASQVTSFVGNAFSDARGAQQLMGQTQAVIESTGGAAGKSATEIADLASSLSDAAGQSLFGDDQIQEAENLLLTFTNVKGAVFDAATAISVDMAQALGGEPKAQAIALGKALNDPIQGVTALTRVGVTFTDEQKAQIKAMQEAGDMAGAQQIILAELNKEFGGSAAAAAEASGGWAEFQGRLGEAGETIASALLPVLGELGTIALDVVMPAIEQVAGWLADNLPGAIAAAQAALEPIIAAFQGAGDSSGVLAGALGFLGGVWEQLQGIVTVAVALIQATVIPIFQAIAGFLVAHSAEIQAILSAAWTIISTVITTTLSVIQGVITAVLAAVQGDWSGAWEAIKGVVSTVWAAIQTIIGAALTIVQNELSMAWSAIQGAVSSAWEGIKGAVQSAIDGLVGIIMALPGQVSAVGGAIVDMIWSGIQGAWDGLVAGLQAKLQELRDMLPFSEPRNTSSPLYGLGRAGVAIVEMIQSGIDQTLLSIAAPTIGAPALAGGRSSSRSGRAAVAGIGDQLGGGGHTLVFNFGDNVEQYDRARIRRDTRAALTEAGLSANFRIRSGG